MVPKIFFNEGIACPDDCEYSIVLANTFWTYVRVSVNGIVSTKMAPSTGLAHEARQVNER